ncbi:MAG: mechanosensitive ion channel [Chloroflexi bacterium]|nr:mechanosensitive ion channel [Chloroflexota bacterium]
MELWLQETLAQAVTYIPKLIAALVIFVVSLYLAGLLAKVLHNILRRREVDPEVSLLLVRLTRWGLIIVGALVALQQAGFKVTAFLAGLGILGFTVGFALQDVSRNLVSGVLLLLQQPFDIGDLIEVQGYLGQVEDVTLRATELRTLDGRLVLIPNADVFTSSLVNYSRTPRRRIEIDVGVAYDSDLTKVHEVALDTVRLLPGTLEEPAPWLWFHTFNESSIDFTLYFWVDTRETDIFQAKSTALQAIKEAFDREGIEIPYPIRTVYLEQSQG